MLFSDIHSTIGSCRYLEINREKIVHVYVRIVKKIAARCEFSFNINIIMSSDQKAIVAMYRRESPEFRNRRHRPRFWKPRSKLPVKRMWSVKNNCLGFQSKNGSRRFENGMKGKCRRRRHDETLLRSTVFASIASSKLRVREHRSFSKRTRYVSQVLTRQRSCERFH